MKRPQGLDAPPATGPGPADAAPLPAARADRRTPSQAVQTSENSEDSPASQTSAAPDPSPLASLRLARATLRSARRARRAKRRDDVRRFRRRGRRGRRLTMISFATATLVLAGAAAVSVSPLTALRQVQVEGADAVVAAQVRHALSGQLGRPLALIDRSAVHDELSALTRIGSYSLLLEPPATMVVRVVERVPLAAVRRGGGYAVVDAAGITLQVSAATPSLPLVTSAVGSAGFRAAVTVIQALPQAIDERISTVSATTTDDVSFTLRGRKGATVVWGDHSHAALKARVLAALLKAAPHASRYDVSSPNDAVTR